MTILGDLTYVVWIAIIILGLAFVAEGGYLASHTPATADPVLKLAIYGLSIAIMGIGLTFIPLGISEIRRARDSRGMNEKLDKIIKMLEESKNQPQNSAG